MVNVLNVQIQMPLHVILLVLLLHVLMVISWKLTRHVVHVQDRIYLNVQIQMLHQILHLGAVKMVSEELIVLLYVLWEVKPALLPLKL